MVSSKRDSGIWIRTLTISGDSTYKCTANNSVGVRSSDYINFSVGGETREFFEYHHRAPMSQLVEHRAVTREVVSSTPAGPTLRFLK